MSQASLSEASVTEVELVNAPVDTSNDKCTESVAGEGEIRPEEEDVTEVTDDTDNVKEAAADGGKEHRGCKLMPGIDWVSMSIAYFSVFVDMAGVSIILPIIPFLVLSFGGNGSEYGIVVASYAFAQMISVPVSGWLSDRYLNSSPDSSPDPNPFSEFHNPNQC